MRAESLVQADVTNKTRDMLNGSRPHFQWRCQRLPDVDQLSLGWNPSARERHVNHIVFIVGEIPEAS